MAGGGLIVGGLIDAGGATGAAGIGGAGIEGGAGIAEGAIGDDHEGSAEPAAVAAPGGLNERPGKPAGSGVDNGFTGREDRQALHGKRRATASHIGRHASRPVLARLGGRNGAFPTHSRHHW